MRYRVWKNAAEQSPHNACTLRDVFNYTNATLQLHEVYIGTKYEQNGMQNFELLMNIIVPNSNKTNFNDNGLCLVFFLRYKNTDIKLFLPYEQSWRFKGLFNSQCAVLIAHCKLISILAALLSLCLSLALSLFNICKKHWKRNERSINIQISRFVSVCLYCELRTTVRFSVCYQTSWRQPCHMVALTQVGRPKEPAIYFCSRAMYFCVMSFY